MIIQFKYVTDQPHCLSVDWQSVDWQSSHIPNVGDVISFDDGDGAATYSTDNEPVLITGTVQSRIWFDAHTVRLLLK